MLKKSIFIISSLVALTCAAYAAPAKAQANAGVPQVVTGATSNGQPIVQSVGTGPANSTPMPVDCVEGCSASGGGTPGGTNGQIQYNHNNEFGGFDVSGDGTINTSTGSLTVFSTNGSRFAPCRTGDLTVTTIRAKGIDTVSNLPTCDASTEGTRMGVSDASSPTWNQTVSGGGTTHIPVYCNGANWVAE